ncbi:MAG: general secretion pathway protein GspB [Candidatus Binatia bacterium]
MSSILDALEKIEATGDPQPSGGGGGGGPERRPRWRLALLVVVALAAGAGAGILLLGRRDAAPPEATPVAIAATTLPTPTTSTTTTAPAPTTSTIPPAAELPAVVPEAPLGAAPVPPPSTGDRERPWGAAQEPAATAEETPPSTAVLAVGQEAPSTTTVPAPPAAPPAPVAEAEPPPRRPPAGVPHLRVSFLVYSSVPARRTVALTIGDAGLTTLHEGDEVGGLGVVRIHPDRVELRWNGEAFTLEVRG